MTIEEIRDAKTKAQEAITETLSALHEQTGLIPIGVSVIVGRAFGIGDKEVLGVSIEMEAI